jgi:hypothetical protein
VEEMVAAVAEAVAETTAVDKCVLTIVVGSRRRVVAETTAWW